MGQNGWKMFKSSPQSIQHLGRCLGLPLIGMGESE